MQEKEHTLSKKCRLGDAFRYIRKHWAALCNFCDDGLAEVDNNAAERALRAVCLGKKTFRGSLIPCLTASGFNFASAD